MHEKHITICVCASRSFIDKDKAAIIAATAQKKGYTVKLEADLCKKALKEPTDMSGISNSILLACYPRAIRSLFKTLDIRVPEVINLREDDIQEVLEQLSVFGIGKITDSEKEPFLDAMHSFQPETGTDAWYPVLDKDKCVECEKCHDFCLFGVYSVENGRVKVANPQNCKNNCPACARVCPAKAVIFPKYEKSPINGGLQNEEQAIAIDTKTVYADVLKQRLQHRRAGILLKRKEGK